MKPSTLLLAFVATSHAYIVPASLPDGQYTISFDANGNAIGEPRFVQELGGVNATAHALEGRQTSLPGPTINCRDRRVTRGDYDNAVASMKNECDKGIYYNARTAVWWTSGSAIAYLCNYDNSNRCWRGEVEQAANLVDANCGRSNIGWVYIDAYKKSYGRENSGVNICF
ncbi:hypothetical protein OQA88_5172 [Cercophora sp. LCS_1]